MSDKNEDTRERHNAADIVDSPPPKTRNPKPEEAKLAPRPAPAGTHAIAGTGTPRRTAAGTPCARSWSDDWVAQIEAAEAREGRRICGARTMAGGPCLLESNHGSGRCRFHGGFDLTGAPKGNRNAVLHGLYSRRLAVCGTHCARWETCPLAGDDVAAAARTRIQKSGDRRQEEDGEGLSAISSQPSAGGRRGEESSAGEGQGDGPVHLSDRSDPTDQSDGEDRETPLAHSDQQNADRALGSPSSTKDERRATSSHCLAPSGPQSEEPAGCSKAFEERTASCLPNFDSTPPSGFQPEEPKGSSNARAARTGSCLLTSDSSAVLYTCPYEQTEYNAVLTDALALVEANGSAFDAHTAHMAALLQVMVSRAAGALAQASLFETTVVESGEYRQESTKLHVFLQAFLRLQREHGRVRKSLEALRGDTARMVTVEPTTGPEGGCRTTGELGESFLEQEPSVEPVKRHAQRAAHDVDLDPDAQAAIHFEDAIARDRAEQELARAVLYGTRGRDIPMLDAVERAWLLDPELVERREQAVLSAYRPGKEVLPEKAVRRVVRAMTRKVKGLGSG